MATSKATSQKPARKRAVKTRHWHDNFIMALRKYMADKNLENYTDISKELGIAYMTLYKIVNKEQKPTVEQCIILCRKAHINANWMLMNLGEPDMQTEADLQSLMADVQAMKAKLLMRR